MYAQNRLSESELLQQTPDSLRTSISDSLFCARDYLEADIMSSEIPLCACGCGTPVKENKKNDKKKGIVKGTYQNFIFNHHIRINNPVWDKKVVEKIRKKAIGRLHTQEAKNKISEANKGRKTTLGKNWKLNHRKYTGRNREKNNFWKGGKTKLGFKIRNSLEYRFWRDSVFQRDNYTCVFCGRRSQKGDKVIIQADHIIPLSKMINIYFIKTIQEAIDCKELWDIDNGRTLCTKCHKQTETYGVNLDKKKSIHSHRHTPIKTQIIFKCFGGLRLIHPTPKGMGILSQFL